MTKKKNTNLLELVAATQLKSDVPEFKPGDTIKVHSKIVEGSKERIQIFEGVVIKRPGKSQSNASFTVRKISYNVGVERTFLVHSPRIAKIEIVSRGEVRRSRLFYLRPLRGKATRIKSKFDFGKDTEGNTPTAKSPKSTETKEKAEIKSEVPAASAQPSA